MHRLFGVEAMRRYVLVAVALGLLAGGAVTPAAAHVKVVTIRETAVGSVSVLPGSVAALGASHLSATVNTIVARSTLSLTASVEQLVSASGGSVGVTLIELGGATPVVWSFNGGEVFTAASTYKLAALMMEAQSIAAGATDPNGEVCYQEADYESGWFDDYADGACFTRNELAQRAAIYSDNTAGHMLVRDVGGADALNAWAASIGATQSVLFTDNTTTSNDLAMLWDAEATGKLGGAAAQAWLYPLLTNTRTESGIPAGVAPAGRVAHKTGTIDDIENDAALVTNGPNGAYILTVMTSGLGGDSGWQLISAVSSSVWSFEASRAK
jgi:beta-lactamase class A